jgi:transaldolase
LCAEQGQSPWLDNLRRDWLHDGTLAGWIDRGILGCTSNPSIFQKAMTTGDAYDDEFASLIRSGATVDEAYWTMVRHDIDDALALFAPVHAAADGGDGFVSLELAPDIARDTAASIEAARRFFTEIAQPNLMVKIPGTREGIPAIEAMCAEGRNVNITLIFGLDRYAEVMEAYIGGLERFDGDLAQVRSVASFFVSRVDTEVDRRLEAIGTPGALGLRGRAAVAQAKLAYRMFRQTFSGPRWEALATRGAHVQRPLWASTSTKNPEYPPTVYIDELIGPDTVNTIPDATLELFEKAGVVDRTIDIGLDGAEVVMEQLADAGVDMADVAGVLEDEGVAAFAKAFDELHASLSTKAQGLG